MRRIARTAFMLSAAVSLVLCHTACVLWARSYTASDQVVWTSSGGSQHVRTARGSLEIGVLLADWSNQPAGTFGLQYLRDEARAPFNFIMLLCSSAGDVFIDRAWGGFEWHARQNERTGVLNGFGVVPFWSVAAVLGAPPLAWAVTWRRSRVRRRRELLGV